MDLSIIILNYKSLGLTKQCLRGIKSSRVNLAHEIIVVDNCSRDNSVENLKQEFPADIKIIDLSQNRGYAAGNNAGINQSEGRYILILNPDVTVFPGVLEKLVQFMDQNPAIGMAGPKLINPNATIQNSCYRFPAWYTPILRRSPLGKLSWAKKHLNQYLMRDFDHKSSRPVDWLLGACLIIRRQALNAVGLLDEEYFLYIEDTDWCRRFWENNWPVYYLANIELVHYHKRESANNSGIGSVLSYPTRIHLKSFVHYLKKFKGKANPRISPSIKKN